MSPPALSEVEEQIIVRERLRLLAIGFYVKGAVGALFISFLLIHFFMFLAFSFMPESAWNQPPKSATTTQTLSVTPSPSPRPANQGPPAIMFRIFAAVIGLVILLGWTFGALTVYAGRCVQNRTHRLFIYIMAALNCALLPWGTLLGIATFYLMQSPAGRREFGLPAAERTGRPALICLKPCRTWRSRLRPPAPSFRSGPGRPHDGALRR